MNAALQTGLLPVARKLLASLGLDAPRPKPDGSIALTIDGIDLALGESPDGLHVVISAPIGRLSQDAPRRADQVHRLLRASLGLLLTNEAGLRLDRPGEDGTADVRAVAMGPARLDAVPVLTARIEDVLQLIETHRPLLAGSVALRAVEAKPAPSSWEDSLIFRP